MSIKVQVKNNVDRTRFNETMGTSRAAYGKNGQTTFGYNSQMGIAPTTNWFTSNEPWAGTFAPTGQFPGAMMGGCETTMINRVIATNPTLAPIVSQFATVDPILVAQVSKIAGTYVWTAGKLLQVAAQDIVLAKALIVLAQSNLHLVNQLVAQAVVSPIQVRQQLQMIGLPVNNVTAINSLMGSMGTPNLLSGINTGVNANYGLNGFLGANFSPVMSQAVQGTYAPQANYGLNGAFSPVANGSVNQVDVAPMKVDIFDDGIAYIIEAEIPGAVSDDVDVMIKDGKLVIEAVCTRACSYTGTGTPVLKEKPLNKVWRREFAIGHDIDVQDISASLVGGILKLVLPRLTVADALTACQVA